MCLFTYYNTERICIVILLPKTNQNNTEAKKKQAVSFRKVTNCLLKPATKLT